MELTEEAVNTLGEIAECLEDIKKAIRSHKSSDIQVNVPQQKSPSVVVNPAPIHIPEPKIDVTLKEDHKPFRGRLKINRLPNGLIDCIDVIPA